MLILMICLGFIGLIVILAILTKPRTSHSYIVFPYPPGFARINTPRDEWDEKRRTVILSNEESYIIPVRAKGHFVLLHDWTIECGRGVDKRTYILPKGFATDFASIPRILHSLISPISNSVYGAVLHDYLYRNPTDPVASATTKADADRYFYWGLRACGVNRLTAGLMYIGVVIGGRIGYKRR